MRARGISLALCLVAGLVAAPYSSRPVSAWAPQEPPDGKFAWVGVCETPDQLDCVESIGAYINGSYVAGALSGRLADPGSELIDGQWVKNVPDDDWYGWFQREWSIPGLVNEDGTSNIIAYGRLASSNVKDVRCNPLNPSQGCAPMLDFYAAATWFDGFKRPWESGSQQCWTLDSDPTSPFFGKCTRLGNLQQGIKFRIVIRTSWLLPTVVVSKSDQTIVTTERLPISGASRISIEGIPYKTVGLGPGVNYRDDPNSRASWNDVTIKIQLIDGRLWRNGMYSRCADNPPIVVADNSWAPSTPTFDASGGLQLNVTNSHYDTDGVTPFEGKYNGRVPLAMASCLWGENLSSKSQFVAEVIEAATGEKKAATTAVSVNEKELKIDAYGFTFSSPTIRVKYVATASPVSPKKQTITCKKGKTVRKITSLRPKCPAGFKKA